MGYVSPGRQVDLEKLGGALVVAAAVILAIRTASRDPIFNPRDSNREWEAEMDFALNVASALLFRATCDHAELFRQTIVNSAESVIAEDEMR